jgi:hypothetical protein
MQILLSREGMRPMDYDQYPLYVVEDIARLR